MRRRRTIRTLLPAAVAVTVLLGGCSDGADDDPDVALERTSPPVATSPLPSAVTSSPTPAGDTRAWATCVSSRASLRVSYPEGWTARDYPGGGCAYFDPQPFEVERGTEAPSVAVRLDVEDVPYDRVRSAYLDGQVASQQKTTVAGYDALRIEDSDTDGPLTPKGERLTYLADLGNQQTLILTTNETDAEDFEQAQEILDQMADRLERTG